MIREWIGQLTEKQRVVIQYRYGLDDVEVLTLEDLAQLRRILKRRGVLREVLF